MNRTASLPSPIAPDAAAPDLRRVYEGLLVRAMRCAVRLVPRDQAFELAHDVAVEMLHRPPDSISATLIFMKVTSRLGNLRRGAARRAAREAAYVALRPDSAPAWSQPGSELEARELRDRIDDAVRGMPSGMRDAFLLVRKEELTYRDAAGRLGVSVSTVHTQLSRANSILRDCVKRYHADEARTHRSAEEPTR